MNEQEELKAQKKVLSDICKQLGISFSNNATVEQLQEKLANFSESYKVQQSNNTQVGSITRVYDWDNDPEKEATRLVRCIISCKNPNKVGQGAELFTVGNAVVDEISKVIPYDKPVHVPFIMLNKIKESKFTFFYSVMGKHGKNITKTRLESEYEVKELPPLTQEQYEEIYKRQILENRQEVED